jgi:hypothetical protein
MDITFHIADVTYTHMSNLCVKRNIQNTAVKYFLYKIYYKKILFYKFNLLKLKKKYIKGLK